MTLNSQQCNDSKVSAEPAACTRFLRGKQVTTMLNYIWQVIQIKNNGCHSVQRSVGGMLISLCEAIEARDRYTRTSMIPDLPSQTALPLPLGC